MSVKASQVDLHQTDTRPDYGDLELIVYQEEGKALLGSSPSVYVALTSSDPIFHEAGVYFSNDSEDCAFVTSNILSEDRRPSIQIHKLSRQKSSPTTWKKELIPQGLVTMANGGIATPAKDGIIFCSQGNKVDTGGLFWMSKDAPYETKPLLRTYHGRRFNSVNDVVHARDGAIWFTDPIYGYEQGFRTSPELPSQLYRFDPKTNDVRVVADGFQRPNGLCFNPRESTLYVTDTDWIHGDGSTDHQRVSHIYAFTVKDFYGAPFLTERRLFAMADTGAPDGIKCDAAGNVWSGCGDGVNVWSSSGKLILKIIVEGGVANFCFGAKGEVLMLNETRFVVANLDKTTVMSA